MKYGLWIMLVTLIVLPLSCGKDVTDPPYPPELTPEDIVKLNSHAVQQAAEAFAAENDGEYPADLRDRSAGGNTLIDLLPGGALLENPFTSEVDVPTPLTAVYPGETAYRAFSDVNYVPTGYRITGFGAEKRIITLSNLPDSVFEKDEKVIENCFIVRDAAEAFAADNNGLYPLSVWSDVNLLGLILIDYLPNGERLPNPYSDDHPTVPVDVSCVQIGSSGYKATGGPTTVGAGYEIDGCGRDYYTGVIIRILKPWWE